MILALVLSSAFVIGSFAVDQAEAVGEGCPNKKGSATSPNSTPTPQLVSTELSRIQIF